MMTDRIRVLLTVPHVCRSASPYREMRAIAGHFSPSIDLTVCALRGAGWEETKPILDRLGVSCFVAPFRPRGRSPRALMESLAGQRLIARHGPFAIQHSLDFTSSPFEALMARAAGRIYIFNQRNLNDEGHLASLRLKTRLSHAVIAIAGHMAGFLRDIGVPSSKIVEIHNGIDLDDVDSELGATARTPAERILMVGQVVRLKRYEDAIRAFRRISTQHPELTLDIVGHFYDSGYRVELESLTTSLHLDGRVRFVGGRADVLALMRDSRALLICSRSEGLPWALLEGMAASVPVVASDIPAHREVLGATDASGLVRVGDCEGYAATLERVLSLPPQPPSVRAARARVESKYSGQAMAAGVERLYQRLCGRKPNLGTVHEGLRHLD